MLIGRLVRNVRGLPRVHSGIGPKRVSGWTCNTALEDFGVRTRGHEVSAGLYREAWSSRNIDETLFDSTTVSL